MSLNNREDKKKELLIKYGESKKNKFRVVNEFSLREKANVIVIECDETPITNDMKNPDLDEYLNKHKNTFEKDHSSIITYVMKENNPSKFKIPIFTQKDKKSPFELFKELNDIK
jgi:hypothetical protein